MSPIQRLRGLPPDERREERLGLGGVQVELDDLVAGVVAADDGDLVGAQVKGVCEGAAGRLVGAVVVRGGCDGHEQNPAAMAADAGARSGGLDADGKAVGHGGGTVMVCRASARWARRAAGVAGSAAGVLRMSWAWPR